MTQHSNLFQYLSRLWQNQQNGMCAQQRLRLAWASAQSEQSLLKKALVLSNPLSTAKTLIRLGGCPGWSESLLGPHAILLVLSWGGSFRCDIRIASSLVMIWLFASWSFLTCSSPTVSCRFTPLCRDAIPTDTIAEQIQFKHRSVHAGKMYGCKQIPTGNFFMTNSFNQKKGFTHLIFYSRLSTSETNHNSLYRPHFNKIM